MRSALEHVLSPGKEGTPINHAAMMFGSTTKSFASQLREELIASQLRKNEDLCGISANVPPPHPH